MTCPLCNSPDEHGIVACPRRWHEPSSARGFERVSDCCSNPLAEDGSCQWCGKSSGSHLRRDDALLSEIEAALCDWNKPSSLDTYELWPNIFKVARLVKKHRGPQ